MGKCECGCGIETKPMRRFLSGHNLPMRMPEIARKQAKSLSNTLALKRAEFQNRKEYFAQWHIENRARRLEAARLRKIKLKREVLSYYGQGSCSCLRCSYNRLPALTLDHIADDGFQERRSGHEFYAYLKKRGFPEGYQTLCMNCQYLKRDENGNHTLIKHD